jgi:hypothetical protein
MYIPGKIWKRKETIQRRMRGIGVRATREPENFQGLLKGFLFLKKQNNTFIFKVTNNVTKKHINPSY